ncbi:zinc ribbon domain-containing protein [Tenacibaculum discolor]|uniref:zinc ribbon domain-containing protein n=1 Tax=Tenacibaculum discolor TaxID=361581 RepID=UPI000EAC7459|nr:zinc ribbon domain-containing protein [Tenacibaculum discolor]RLK06570.1 putative zinc ribbon protein [Tenacibaculum discolor]
MSINIPDKIYKLLVLIGLIIAGYSTISITNLYSDYSLRISELSSEEISTKGKLLSDVYDNIKLRLSISSVVGTIIFFAGLIGWYRDKKHIKQTDRTYESCQSCGKTFSSIRNYGTNKDGTHNLGLCIECYDNGEFTNPNLKLTDLIEEAYDKGYEDKNTWVYEKLEKRLKGLDRWKSHEY